MLLGLELKGYAVFKDFQIGLTDPTALLTAEQEEGQATLFRPLRPLCAFVGRNSTGKTLIFEALDLLADSLRHDIQYACNAKGRLGYSSLKTADGSADGIFFKVHVLCRKTAEILSWQILLVGDEFDRPHLVSEQVTGISCTRRRLQLLGLGQRSISFPQQAERYAGERLYLKVEGGRGLVSSDGSLNCSVDLDDSTRSALALYGVQRQFPALHALADQVRRWYFCRQNAGENTFYQAAEQSRLAGAQERAGGGHKHLDEYMSNTRNFLLWFKEKKPEIYRSAMREIGGLMGRGDSIRLNRLPALLQGNEGKLFNLLLLLKDPGPRPLIMLENPDVGLFYDRVEGLAEAMRQYVINGYPEVQLFFNTHNNSLLDMANPAEVWNYERTEDGGARAVCLADIPLVAAMYDEGISLGAQWYSGHFDQPATMTTVGSQLEEGADGEGLDLTEATERED